MVKIVHDELASLMGGRLAPHYNGPPRHNTHVGPSGFG
jgi:hypothetical protein